MSSISRLYLMSVEPMQKDRGSTIGWNCLKCNNSTLGKFTVCVISLVGWRNGVFIIMSLRTFSFAPKIYAIIQIIFVSL